MKKLPLAESSFERMIEENYTYVDKTKEIYDLIHYSRYVFLSRPRRFGKSLLISTLEAIFQGKKELFKGLWIEDKIEWKEYPVIRIDFGRLSYRSLENFEEEMSVIIEEYAEKYEVTLPSKHYASKMNNLIRRIYLKTGRRVVVLIDEYDAPIARHITDLKLATDYQDSLRDFYSIIKASNHEVQFVFLTGISKFAKMSIFSVINLMKDVSLLPQFNNILGFKMNELQQYFSGYIHDFAEKKGVTKAELLDQLATWYDGYKWEGEDKIFNPYSVVNVLQDKDFKNYWFETGTPAILMKLIKEKYAQERETTPTMEEFENIQTVALDGSYDLREAIPLPKLLYETGYLTIKELEYVLEDKLYTLSYPNYEVRNSFNAFILSAFSNDRIDIIQSKGTLMKKALLENDKERFLVLLRSLFSALPYHHRKEASEAYYHGLFYLVLTLLGIRVNLEDVTNKGRIDCTLELLNKVYIIEFKYSEKGTMDYLLKQAMNQIKQLKYYEPFEGLGKEIWFLGVGFLVKDDVKLKKKVLTIEGEMKRYN